jgi:hypothetical protein
MYLTSYLSSSFAAQYVNIGSSLYDYNYVMIIVTDSYTGNCWGWIRSIILPTSGMSIRNTSYKFISTNSIQSSIAGSISSSIISYYSRTIYLYLNSDSDNYGKIYFNDDRLIYITSDSVYEKTNVGGNSNVPYYIIGFN